MADDDGAHTTSLTATEAGARVDVYIAAHVPELSRSRIAQLLAAGHIRLNGKVPRKSTLIAAGDRIEIDIPAPEPSAVEAEDIPLRIVYEDADIAVVDKPAGLVVHPAPGHRGGTLVNALLHHLGDLSGIGGVLRPGIVHRLDKDTSGLLLIAKHDQAHRVLAAALKRRDVKRIYQVAAWGHLRQDSITVDAPIARSHNDRQRMAVLPEGRNAVTHFTRLAIWPAADLLRAELETGRTHQIRVHAAHAGYPLAGDEKYGDAEFNEKMKASGLTRMFLHAHQLSFVWPETGVEFSVSAPLPADLAAVIDVLNPPRVRK